MDSNDLGKGGYYEKRKKSNCHSNSGIIYHQRIADEAEERGDVG